MFTCPCEWSWQLSMQGSPLYMRATTTVPLLPYMHQRGSLVYTHIRVHPTEAYRESGNCWQDYVSILSH